MKYIISILFVLSAFALMAQVDSTFRENQSWAWVTEDHPDSLVPPLTIAEEGDLFGPELIYNKETGNLWVFNPEDSTFSSVQTATNRLSNFAIEAEVATNTTLSGFNVLLPVNSTSGIVEIDLPAGTPAAEDQFKIVDSRSQASVNNITVDFVNSGDSLHGASQNYVINTASEAVIFTYINATIGWIAED